MCKKCPVDQNHAVKEVQISQNMKYDLCDVCKEDVEFLARQRGVEWDEEEETWVTAQATAHEEEYDDEEYDDEEYDDEDDDGYNPPMNMGPPPITPQMRPTLNLGQGTHQMMLLSDDQVEASYVMQILTQTLQMNAVSAQYTVMKCHFDGRTAIKYGSEQELQALQAQIDAAKQAISQSGGYYCDTILNLQVVIEQRQP